MSLSHTVFDVLDEADHPPPPAGWGWPILAGLLGAAGLVATVLGYRYGVSLGLRKNDLLFLGLFAAFLAIMILNMLSDLRLAFERQQQEREWVQTGAVTTVDGVVEVYETKVPERAAAADNGRGLLSLDRRPTPAANRERPGAVAPGHVWPATPRAASRIAAVSC